MSEDCRTKEECLGIESEKQEKLNTRFGKVYEAIGKKVAFSTWLTVTVLMVGAIANLYMMKLDESRFTIYTIEHRDDSIRQMDEVKDEIKALTKAVTDLSINLVKAFPYADASK